MRCGISETDINVIQRTEESDLFQTFYYETTNRIWHNFINIIYFLLKMFPLIYVIEQSCRLIRFVCCHILKQ